MLPLQKIKTKAKAKASSFGEWIQKDLGDEHGSMKRTILSHVLVLEKSKILKLVTPNHLFSHCII